MVSFQAPFLQLNQRKAILESDSNSKKRKWEDHDSIEAEDVISFKQWKNPKADATTTVVRSFSNINLHLETPLPSEWQRCLDIQSGEIHFYNSRTQKRTLKDPRESPEQTSPRDCHISLDLELNLPCGSLNYNSSSKHSEKTTPMVVKKSSSSSPTTSTDLFKCLSKVEKNTSSNDIAKDDQEAEMVATACMRCHMLVMLQKSSPTCPNCKFVHPPYQSSPDIFKPRLSLSC